MPSPLSYNPPLEGVTSHADVRRIFVPALGAILFLGHSK
jgi:hypothetical protein